MKAEQILASISLLLAAAEAAPLGSSFHRREVPQEHSHEQFLTTVRASLNINNPDQIQDPVFGLLGDAAAKTGAGKITDVSCLQTATADRAFTNAKAAGDVKGMTAALIFRAIERNTGKVGLASAACTSFKPSNPEIAALTQHQDPASPEASGNKAITLELAKQIASIGGDPQEALKSGTFAPGNLNDNTGKGNSCDDANDPVGCIFTQNLLVEDATAAEIDAAVGGAGAGAGTGNAAQTTAATQAAQTVAATSVAACRAAPVATTAAAAPAAAETQAATPAAGASSGALDFGSCSDPTVVFGPGFDGRKEDSFVPANSKDFNHGSALNLKVISGFICQQLQDKCKASASTVTACNDAATVANALTGQAAADSFNAFANGGSSGSAAAAPAPAGTTAAAAQPAATQAASSNNNNNNAASSSGALDFGNCPNVAIQFGVGFDGRKDPSFQPADKKAFTHDSALNIKVITGFMIDRLKDSCKASAAAVSAAEGAATAANAVTGQAAADAWNNALGA